MPVPEPVERAAVDEDEGAHGRVARPPRAVLRRPAAPLRGQAEGPPEAADGLAADREALDLPELLGAVAVIEVAVRGLDQLDDAVPDLDSPVPGARAGSAADGPAPGRPRSDTGP